MFGAFYASSKTCPKNVQNALPMSNYCSMGGGYLSDYQLDTSCSAHSA